MGSKKIYLSPPHLSGNERDFVAQAFDSNWIAPVGPQIDLLEEEFAAHVGVEAAAAVSSGTSALHLALRVLGVSNSDRVFCSNFTFIASANPILYQGAVPVLIDSESDSWNMSPNLLREALEEHNKNGTLPKAIIVVGLYGQTANMRAICDLAKKFGVPVIEDAAECLGGKFEGNPSGSIADLSAFSFNGNKIITGSGGGMLVSNDVDLITKAKKLATQAREPVLHYEHVELGYNYRMSNIVAAICRGQLQLLNERVIRRRSIFYEYVERLHSLPGIGWMPEPIWSKSSRWLSCFTVEREIWPEFQPAALVSYLESRSIEARPLWKPLHMQPVLAGCELYFDQNNAESRALSEDLFSRGVCLPSGSSMSRDDVMRVSACVADYWSENVI